MRYAQPRAREVIADLRRAGARRVLLLPLCPHHSFSTSGSSLREFAREAEYQGFHARFDVVHSWGAHPSYSELFAATCEDALREIRRETKHDVQLIFSAHGVPERYIQQGDSYQREVEETAGIVRAWLAESCSSISLGYQSALGPVKWIGPSTAELIEKAARANARALVVARLGFVSDHIETLYDMDALYRKQAESEGRPAASTSQESATKRRDSTTSRSTPPLLPSSYPIDPSQRGV